MGIFIILSCFMFHHEIIALPSLFSYFNKQFIILKLNIHIIILICGVGTSQTRSSDPKLGTGGRGGGLLSQNNAIFLTLCLFDVDLDVSHLYINVSTL